MSLKERLQEDTLYTKNIKRILKIEMKDEKWIEEISSLHVREIRALNSSDILQNAPKTIDRFQHR